MMLNCLSWCGILLEILNSVVAPAIPPTYATIMSLDKKLRLQPTPDKFSGSRRPCAPVDIQSYSHPSLRWQEQIVYASLMHAQMILHRPFFAVSLFESSADLSRGKYAKSISAVFDGAKALLSQLLWLREHEIDTLRGMHMWPFYAMLCLVCSIYILYQSLRCIREVALGGIAAEAPKSSYSKSSFKAFELGCQLMLDGDDTNDTCPKRIVSYCFLTKPSLTKDSVLLCSKYGMPPTQRWYKPLDRTSRVMCICAPGSPYRSARRYRLPISLQSSPSAKPLRALEEPVTITFHNFARIPPPIRAYLVFDRPRFHPRTKAPYNRKWKIYLRISSRCASMTTLSCTMKLRHPGPSVRSLSLFTPPSTERYSIP